MKNFTQVMGPDLHQMKHKYQGNISSPVLSKNLSGVPLILSYIKANKGPGLIVSYNL
jgi:hypothetical protein